ncbi:O-antigen ligase family protein [Tenacibaculum sp. TC6]|uniref:O-antigen ligase family protein n=1 Tax=Tenacibaculum sp. TC6 TaxID=3423223 RepID=UPI003D36409B
MIKIKSLILSLLVFSSTLVSVNQSFIYVVLAFLGMVLWFISMRKNGVKREDILSVLFLLTSSIIYYVGKEYAIDDNSKSINNIIPYTFFIIATVNFSKSLNNSVIKYILYFILLEIVVGIVQYLLGTPYFIKPNSVGVQEFGESEYLYYNKVYGLSAVTSIFALKIFTGFLLVYHLKYNKAMNYFFYGLLLLGLIITFNRTAIVSVIVFGFIALLMRLKTGGSKIKFLTILMSVVLLVLAYNNYAFIENQFFRGKGVDLSGRDLVFPYYIQFIVEHPFLGNYFTKHWAELSIDRVYHAHNSYLQTVANMGILFGFATIVYFILKVNKNNYIYIVPILVYSTFQYGILWGVSFLDIVFFYFLFKKNKK